MPDQYELNEGQILGGSGRQSQAVAGSGSLFDHFRCSLVRRFFTERSGKLTRSCDISCWGVPSLCPFWPWVEWRWQIVLETSTSCIYWPLRLFEFLYEHWAIWKTQSIFKINVFVSLDPTVHSMLNFLVIKMSCFQHWILYSDIKCHDVLMRRIDLSVKIKDNIDLSFPSSVRCPSNQMLRCFCVSVLKILSLESLDQFRVGLFGRKLNLLKFCNLGAKNS